MFSTQQIISIVCILIGIGLLFLPVQRIQEQVFHRELDMTMHDVILTDKPLTEEKTSGLLSTRETRNSLLTRSPTPRPQAVPSE